MKIVLAGGSGSLGRRIADDLGPRGHEIVVLTRLPGSNLTVRQVYWDVRGVGYWAAELEGSSTSVIDLAGKLVDCRPSAHYIAELSSSRVLATHALMEASLRLNKPLTHWIQASTTAIWSVAGDTRCTESAPLPTVGLPRGFGLTPRTGLPAGCVVAVSDQPVRNAELMAGMRPRRCWKRPTFNCIVPSWRARWPICFGHDW